MTVSPHWQLELSAPGSITLILSGDWTVSDVVTTDAQDVLEALAHYPEATLVTLDGRALGAWDSVLMTFLLDLIKAKAVTLSPERSTLPEGVIKLIDLATAVPEREGARRDANHVQWLQKIGESTRLLWLDGLALTRFVGEAVLAFAALAGARARFRPIDLWLQIQECGPAAVPIVTLISLLVGLILAFVGAVQLALFGAQLYIADLVALGMTREMGALMTAIIMSGRSGAAFAAQIGTMNVNLELSALRVMGFDPVEFLVLPRMLALILVMPLLCLYADLLGIIGGGMVSVAFFDTPLTQYLHRTAEAVKLGDFFVGLFKCGVFGVLIALAGCLRGMQCGRSASAVGDAATSAVVTGIVFIVIADSIITLICNRLNI
ncbi:MAG: MlaE family ABC transporter permease [Methylococcaceae bacterium]|jgi:phospholipid/cholesterol/gamma-HCH transport system permease protein